MLPRWERHWWQKTEPVKPVAHEPTVWVDPSLYEEERATRRLAQGTIPPPDEQDTQVFAQGTNPFER